MHIHIFEAGMLICFGASWPLDIYKSWKSRSTAGKSLMFMIVLSLGYVCGIINKVLYHHDIILTLYIINILMVLADICFYFRNKRIEAKTKINQT